ncbi:Ig-like domain-containing protein [Paenibacillus sp.]|uniref:Ig-like domain-containing protein n=1 Tax=Paenibacillus sp. TaxID=58172 RepID=UPI002810D95B|nr:Ig-like domain-containing protein [Paenibacillus sp.]
MSAAALRALRKSVALWLSICLAIPSLSAAVGSAEYAQAAEGGNLFANGGFETAHENGSAPGWDAIRYSGTPAFSVTDSVYKEGTRSFRISADAVSRGSAKQVVDLAPGQEGKSFVLQFWQKTEGLIENGQAYGRYQFLNGSGSRIGALNYTTSLRGTNDWTSIRKEFTIPAGAVKFSFEGFLENTTGSVWYDDLKLFEVVPDEAPTGNLLPNGGFEAVQASSGWTNGIGPAHASAWKASGNPAFAVDSETYRSGSRSVRIDGAPPTVSRGAVVQEIRTMKIGQPYLISGWVKTENVSNTAYVRFQYKRDGGQSAIVELANNLRGTTDWTYFSRVVGLPDTTDNPSAPVTKVEAFLENSTGTVWFDDFSIQEHIPVESFTLAPDYVELGAGGTAQLSAIVTPENATNRNVRWSSSDPAAVSVDANGLVTAHAAGYSIVSATALETNETRNAVVTIDPSPSLTVEPYSGTVVENGELTGRLTARDDGGAPIVFEKAIDPRHGTVTVEPDGSFRYYPTRNYTGPDEFVFKVGGVAGGGPKFGKASIAVEPILAPPTLDLQWYSTPKGATLTGKLGKVVRPSAEAVVWTKSGSSETQGELVVQPDGTFVYTPAPGFTGYDTLHVTATAANGLSTEAKAKVFVVPEAADFAADLNDAALGNVHPRVVADAEDFAYARSLIGTDPYMTEWFERLVRGTAPFLEAEDNGFNTNQLLNAALLFQLTGDKTYADRAIEHLQYMATIPESAWPGRTNSMLSLTYIAYTTGLAYDWLYHEMTPEQRRVVEETVSEHIFSHALGWYRGQFNITDTNNINLVNNGSYGVLALALLNEDGEQIRAEANEALQGAYRKLQIVLRHLTEDGSWPEGPSYFQYGTMPLFLFMSAMHSSLGTDYGLSELEGMEAFGAYPVYLRGPEGTFNFGDGDILETYPQSLWLADFYGKPEYASLAGELYRDQGLYSPLYLLFYKPGMFDVWPSSPDRTFSGIEAIAMRSGWNDPNAAYAAMRGLNETMLSHNDLDAGTFVFDALGERWALDLGNENYNLPGFWQYAEGTRWTYYRKGTQGHNTVVINPLSNPVHMQDYDAPALLVRSESKPRGAYGVLDLTERYPNDAVSFKRGMMLTADRSQLILQDEIRLKGPSDIYWFMHTGATISILEGGRAAILTKNDKKLYVKMVEAPAGAVFSEMKAEPLPGTPNPEGQSANRGVRKLAVHMTNASEANLSVWMAPLYEEDPLPLSAPGFTPLDAWSIPDGELPVRPALPTASSISANGVPIEGFDPRRTYYEVVFPFEETVVPRVEAASASDLTVVEATELPGRTFVYVTDPANPSLKNRYTVAFVRGPIVGDPPDVNRWPVVGATASSAPQANLGYTPEKTLDGDLFTRWTSEGEHWIQYDLGEAREVGAVSIAFFSGDVRKAYFSISTSLDGIQWNAAYADGVSSGVTAEPEVFHFDGTEARYVRITGYGNSTSRWNNITEVGIFRPTPISVRADVPAVWKPGEQHALSALLRYADGSLTVAENATFASSDETVLSVKDGDKALGKKPGTAELTVTDHEYGLTRTMTIEVRTPKP